MSDTMFQSASFKARHEQPTEVTVFAKGERVSLHLDAPGIVHIFSFDPVGASSLLEALTNALNRVQQVQP